MYYIVTTNSYLFMAIRFLLADLPVMNINCQQIQLNEFTKISDDDVFILDSSQEHFHIFKMLARRTKSPLIIYYGSGPRFCSLLTPCYNICDKLAPKFFLKALFKITDENERERGLTIRLSYSERRILELSLKQFIPKEIASKAGVSVKTVYSLRSSVCRKLGVSKIAMLSQLQMTSFELARLLLLVSDI